MSSEGKDGQLFQDNGTNLSRWQSLPPPPLGARSIRCRRTYKENSIGAGQLLPCPNSELRNFSETSACLLSAQDLHRARGMLGQAHQGPRLPRKRRTSAPARGKKKADCKKVGASAGHQLELDMSICKRLNSGSRRETSYRFSQ